MKVDLEGVTEKTDRVLSRSFLMGLYDFADDVAGAVLDGQIPTKAYVALIREYGLDQVWVKIRWTGGYEPWLTDEEPKMKKRVWEAGNRCKLVMSYVGNGWFDVTPRGGNSEGCWQ